MPGWLTTLYHNSLVQNVLGSIIAAVLASAFTWLITRRYKMPKVTINARRTGSPEQLELESPETLILIFSGINPPSGSGLSLDEFQCKVDAADYNGLGVSLATFGFGHAARAVTHYPSLKRAILLTTSQSHRAVPLLQAFVREKLGCRSCVIEAPEAYIVNLEDDVQVTRAAHAKTKRIFTDLGKHYRPEKSRILVDLTGGPRSMMIGVLLACLGREQDVHLIGSRYDQEGKLVPDTAFPLIVSFAPSLIPERR